VFELTGGHPCLDFANTVDDRRTSSPIELLTSARDLVDWAARLASSPLTMPPNAARARGRQAEVERALIRAREVREAIFAVFSSVARRTRQPPEVWTRWAALLPTLSPLAGWCTVTEASPGSGEPTPPPIWSESSGRSSPRQPTCSAPSTSAREGVRRRGLRWLFLDRSKNGTRVGAT